jgi:catechol 2,3-dioxygenase-like lactoylglutathione lyase family enzyme
MLLREGNVTVVVANLDRSIRFYTETLGLRLRYRAGEEWAEIMGPGLIIGLVPVHELEESLRPDLGRAPARLSIGFIVDKLEVAQHTLEMRGVHFDPDIDESEVVRIAVFSDPDGTPLYLCELRREVL